jgi:DNA-directed RNA polymerase specialized sigma24 family protein
MDSVPEIARRYKMAEGTVKASLHRTRKKLREHLEQKGVQL